MTYSWKMPLAAASRVTGEGEEWEPQVKEEVAAVCRPGMLGDSGLRAIGVEMSGPI